MRGSTGRVPKYPNGRTDIERRQASTLRYEDALAFVAFAESLPDEPCSPPLSSRVADETGESDPTPANDGKLALRAREKQRKALRNGKLLSGRRLPKKTGDKNRDRYATLCYVALSAGLLGGRPYSALTPDEIETLWDSFNAVYHDCGLNTGPVDDDRRSWFDDSLPSVFAKHDPELGGGSAGAGLWFKDDDLRYATKLVRSCVPKHVLRRRTGRLSRDRVSYTTLAFALLTIAKNCNTAVERQGRRYAKEQVPATSIRGMLDYFGLGNNGGQVRGTVELLVDAGLVQYSTRSYGRGRSRSMRLAKASKKLPFVAHLYVEEQVGTGAKVEARDDGYEVEYEEGRLSDGKGNFPPNRIRNTATASLELDAGLIALSGFDFSPVASKSVESSRLRRGNVPFPVVPVRAEVGQEATAWHDQAFPIPVL